MARDDPPNEPREPSERRKQTNRIAEISHRISEIGPQISAQIRGLGHQLTALVDQIQTDNKTTETREKLTHDRSIFWIQIGTFASIIFSVASLVTSVLALFILSNQLSAQRIEHRAWIKIEHETISVAENKPLFAGLTIRNIGKTPASDVDGNFMVRKVKRDTAADLKLVGNVFNAFAGILTPDEGMPAPAPMLDEKADLLNPPRLTKTDVAEIESGESYIVTFERVTYFDAYGISHWINFCSYQWRRPGNYAARNCVEYNKADKN